MEYQPRSYRQQFNPARFASFTVQYLETDLWIGMDHASFRKEIAEVALHEVMDLRTRLDSYIHEFPPFGASLEPTFSGGAPRSPGDGRCLHPQRNGPHGRGGRYVRPSRC